MEQKTSKCRFIPDRRPDLWHKFSATSPEEKTSLQQNISSFRNRNYEKVLRQLFKVPVAGQNLFFPSMEVTNECRRKHWPAKCRRKPYIRKAHMVLDLPTFNNDIALNNIDWGHVGLVCALSTKVYIWKESSEIKSFICTHEADEIITSVKCHPTQPIIGVGTSKAGITIWSPHSTKLSMVTTTTCCSDSSVCALEWHPSELYLMCGCSSGCLLYIYVGHPFQRHLITSMDHSINSIQFSESGDFMATASIAGNMVLWDWLSKHPIAHHDLLSTCKSFAWHPWSSILAVGTSEDGGTIHIFYMKITKKITYKSITPMKVLNLTWSKVTGELVASILVTRDTGEVMNTILIFGSLGEIVDMIEVGSEGYSFYLIWSPDGYEIGTVTPTEMLLIWKFCEKRQNISTTRLSSSILRSNILQSFGGSSAIIR